MNKPVTEEGANLVGVLAFKNYIVNVVLVFCILLFLVAQDLHHVLNLVLGHVIVAMMLITIATLVLVLPVQFLHFDGVMDVMNKDLQYLVTKAILAVAYRVEKKWYVEGIDVFNLVIQAHALLHVHNLAQLNENPVLTLVICHAIIHFVQLLLANKQ